MTTWLLLQTFVVEYNIIIIMYYRGAGDGGGVGGSGEWSGDRRQKQSSTKQTLGEIKSRDLARFL